MSGLAAQLRTLRHSIPNIEREIASQIIAKEAANYHKENFRNESFEGSKWKRRKKRDSSRKLLVKTGRLRRAATSPRTRGNVVDFMMPVYGKHHNNGSGHLPRRQFYGLTSALKKRIQRKANKLITRRLNRN